MTLSSCSTRHVSDLRARSFLTFMPGTRDGSTICQTNSGCGKFLHLTFSCCSKCRNLMRLQTLPFLCCACRWNISLLSTDYDSAYYHTVVLHLFRPFLKVDLTNSKVSPRDICTSCANNATSLVGTYRQIYGLRRVPIIATHILLSTSIIHLLNLPNLSSAQNLALNITCLHGISANHAFAIRSADIIMALSRQWNIHLPSEVTQIAYDLPPEVPASLQDPQASGNGFTYLSSVPDDAQQQDNVHPKDVTIGLPFSAVKNSPRPFATPADMFWSPFPDHSVPLQAHEQNGPMDISAMLDVPNNGWDQLSRDGFRVAQLGDPILSPPAYSHINSHWTQT